MPTNSIEKSFLEKPVHSSLSIINILNQFTAACPLSIF
jgi:hypothetical protein